MSMNILPSLGGSHPAGSPPAWLTSTIHAVGDSMSCIQDFYHRHETALDAVGGALLYTGIASLAGLSAPVTAAAAAFGGGAGLAANGVPFKHAMAGMVIGTVLGAAIMGGTWVAAGMPPALALVGAALGTSFGIFGPFDEGW